MPHSPALFYFHGLDSSERSAKALQCGRYLSRHGWSGTYQVPRLNYDPRLNQQQIRRLVGEPPRPVGLLGSSLGGYYAAWASQQFGLPAVLINPVPSPERLLVDFFGNRENPYTGETYTLGQSDADFFSSWPIEVTRPELLQVWLETGDEVLDYRLAERFFNRCELHLLPGGDHSFVNFEQRLPEMIGFLGANASLANQP